MCNKTCSKTVMPIHYKVLLWISPTAASWVELLNEVIDLHVNKLQSDTHRRPAQELFVFKIDPSLSVYGQNSQQRSSVAVTSWHVTD